MVTSIDGTEWAQGVGSGHTRAKKLVSHPTCRQSYDYYIDSFYQQGPNMQSQGY